MDRSRIPKFYKASIPERLNILNEKRIINEEDFLILMNNLATLQGDEADKMIEDVIGALRDNNNILAEESLKTGAEIDHLCETYREENTKRVKN